MGVYPFMFGCVKDFQPIVDELVKQDQKEPYDWDAYAKVFFPKAEELTTEADAALDEGNTEKASELYLSAPPPCILPAAVVADTKSVEHQQCTGSRASPHLALKASATPGKKAKRSPSKASNSARAPPAK